jgi:hypothetical protein
MTRGHLAAAAAALTFALAAPAAARADTFNFPLQGWWPMNEGSGQIVHDYSGHANNGVLGTSTAVEDSDPQWIPGVFAGSALRFDGGDQVTIPDSPSLEPQKMTVAAWVRGTPANRYAKYIVSKGGLGCDRGSYGLYTGTGGGVAFYIADANTFYESAEAPASIWDGNWHNVAGTFDGHSVRLYVDGQAIGQPTAVPDGTVIDYNLGADGGAFGNYAGDCQNLTLQGDVDGVQIWSQALPVDTIWRILKSLFTTSR